MDRHPSNVAWVRWAARSSWKAMGCSLQPIPTDIEGTCWIRLMRRCVRRMASIRSLSKILIAYSWSKTLAVLTQAPFAQAHCQNQSEHLALPRVPKGSEVERIFQTIMAKIDAEETTSTQGDIGLTWFDRLNLSNAPVISEINLWQSVLTSWHLDTPIFFVHLHCKGSTTFLDMAKLWVFVREQNKQNQSGVKRLDSWQHLCL